MVQYTSTINSEKKRYLDISILRMLPVSLPWLGHFPYSCSCIMIPFELTNESHPSNLDLFPAIYALIR